MEIHDIIMIHETGLVVIAHFFSTHSQECIITERQELVLNWISRVSPEVIVVCVRISQDVSAHCPSDNVRLEQIVAVFVCVAGIAPCFACMAFLRVLC